MKNSNRLLVGVYSLILFYITSIATVYGAAETDPRKPKVQPASLEKKSDQKQNKTKIVIGRVSHNPKKHYKRHKPIVDYVASKLKDLGIIEGKVLLAKNNKQMIQYLEEGKIDWVTETPFSAVLFNEITGAEITLRKWKKGVPNYYSTFITRKDSGINSLNDLKGKKIVFNDPGSTSSYYLPAAVMKNQGLELIKLQSYKDDPPKGKVGYVFSGGDEVNVTIWVLRGFAQAGVFSNQDWEDPTDTPEKFKKDLKILYKTQPVPRALEIFRKDLDPEIKKRIKKILLQIHKDPKAKGALIAYDKTTKFDVINAKVQKKLNNISELLNFVREDLK